MAESEPVAAVPEAEAEAESAVEPESGELTDSQILSILVGNTDAFFLIVIGVIIFFMQCGFAFLEAGSVR